MSDPNPPRPRLLVTEDDPDIARGLELMLRAEYDVTTCGSAEETLEALEKEAPPDLLLVDHQLPGMTGIELVERIRERLESAPPALMISAHTPQMRSSMRAGCQVFIEKPFDPRYVRWAIREALGSGHPPDEGAE